MRKEYRKAAIRLFTEGLARRLPAYKLWKPTLPLVAQGDGKAFFRRPVDTGGCVFIVLAPNIKQDDAFFVELGWSAHDRVPDVTAWPTAFATPERTELSQPGGVVRLGDLTGREMWTTGAIEQAMDADDEGAMLAYLQRQIQPLSASQAEAAMRPLVEDALAALERWGTSYLDAAAERLRREAR
jgi:hypothetical protein